MVVVLSLVPVHGTGDVLELVLHGRVADDSRCWSSTAAGADWPRLTPVVVKNRWHTRSRCTRRNRN